MSAAIAAYAMRTNLTQNLAANMHSVMADYDEGSENYPTEAMDFLQTRVSMVTKFKIRIYYIYG